MIHVNGKREREEECIVLSKRMYMRDVYKTLQGNVFI